jgi:replicative DNA helicase
MTAGGNGNGRRPGDTLVLRPADEVEGIVLDRTIEAEQELLGACMQSAQAVVEVMEVIDPGVFLRPQHEMIFGALVAMTSASEPVTPVTLRAWLERDRDRIDPDYLHALYSRVVMPAAAAALAREVWEEATRRRIVQAGQRLIQLAYDRGEDAADILRRCMEFLDACSRTCTPPGEMALALDELMAMQVPYATPVIPGLLNHQEQVVLLAGEGSGKSELGFQVAFALGAGLHPFIPNRVIPPGRALIIDFENPLPNLQGRTRRHWAIAAESERWHPGNVQIFARPGGIDLWLPAHRFALAEVIRRAEPDLIIGGPIYKMMTMDGERDVAKHSAIARFCDQIKGRHGCAWWLEAHAPATTVGGKRTMRPQGWGGWGQWATFGWALAKAGKDHPGRLVFDRFRDPREEGRDWPVAIDRNRGRGWPWTAIMPEGTFNTPELPPAEDEPAGAPF